MSASRSASVALAAFLAGSVGHATLVASPARAQAPADEPVRREAAVDSAALPTDAQAKMPEASTAPDAVTPPDGPAAVPTTGGPALEPSPGEAAKDETPAAAAPGPPSDPQGAALFARLADPAPLLPRLTTREREAMQAFYALGDFRPVWIQDKAFTPAARAVAARLAAAGEDGLEAKAYPVPALGASGRPGTEAEMADADLRLSAAVALYARDARGGRISLASLSRLITPTLDLPSADVVLARLAAAGSEAGRLLQGYNPSQPGYLALKSRLAALRGREPQVVPSVRLPAGPALKVGMKDPRVPLIRSRFGLEARMAGTLDDPPGESTAYDQGVATAIAGFQRTRGLPASGVLTEATVAALASPGTPRASEGASDLIVNMERWRWLPADLGRDYVLVNIPEFRLRVIRDGRQRDETRVIVGKTESPTPVFSGAMEYAVVNPSWHVPPSILKKEFLPGLARDPNYAARRGYVVVRRGNAISVRQPPGERNALGFIKFLFPNNHAVYLHDTPNRSLFSNANRALSHGCVRVDDPFRFAESVLPSAWTTERLKGLIGKGERTIRLPETLPVHLAYFTAYTDDLGSYRTLPDLYGYDGPMKAALGLGPDTSAVAKLPAEPKRRQAAIEGPVVKPAARRAPVAAIGRSAERVRRAPPDFGEPGLWTPEPPPQPRGWW